MNPTPWPKIRSRGRLRTLRSFLQHYKAERQYLQVIVNETITMEHEALLSLGNVGESRFCQLPEMMKMMAHLVHKTTHSVFSSTNDPSFAGTHTAEGMHLLEG